MISFLKTRAQMHTLSSSLSYAHGAVSTYHNLIIWAVKLKTEDAAICSCLCLALWYCCICKQWKTHGVALHLDSQRSIRCNIEFIQQHAGKGLQAAHINDMDLDMNLKQQRLQSNCKLNYYVPNHVIFLVFRKESRHFYLRSSSRS